MTRPSGTAPRRRSGAAARAAPPLLLLAYGATFGAAALGVALPAFDDHPGQLYRLWHVIARGPAPWAWNPDWWTGAAELQLYPPGFFYLGRALHLLTLGAAPPAAIYQALVWLGYLAPGVLVYAVLARLLGDGWLALPGGFVALTLSAGPASGVEGGVHVGMVPARVAWAWLAALALATLHAPARWWPWLAAPLLAASALTHPAHGPAAAVLVLVALAALPARRRPAAAAVALGLGAALTAFWTLPLLARLEQARALAWGGLEPAGLARHPLLVALLVLAAFAGRAAASPVERALARWPWGVALVVLLIAGLLEPRGIRWLPADRVADGGWMAVVLAAGLATGRGLERLGRRAARPNAVVVGALGAVAAAIALSLPGGTLALWPRAADWPSYAAVARGLRLDDLWTALRAAPPGRVLFVRSGVPLRYGGEWWRPHTHVTALAPIHAGRAIVNGTFTHPSPVAAFVYRGDPGPGAITTLVERLDGHALFGRPLERLDAAEFNRWADRLGVSVVVALDEDLPRLAVLHDNAEFARRQSVGPFVLWERAAGRPLPEPRGAGRWQLAAAGGPGWVPARVAYSPLWRARGAGLELPTRPGPAGDLEVRLATATALVELEYAPGAPELVGLALTALAAVGVALGGARAGLGPTTPGR